MYKCNCEISVFQLCRIYIVFLFFFYVNALKHCQSIKFKPGPTAAITHYLVRTYASYRNIGGEKGKTTTPPVVIRFLCNGTAASSRQ